MESLAVIARHKFLITYCLVAAFALSLIFTHGRL